MLQPCTICRKDNISYTNVIYLNLYICTVIIHAYSSYRLTSAWFMIIILLHHQPSIGASTNLLLHRQRRKSLQVQGTSAAAPTLSSQYHLSFKLEFHFWLVVSTPLKNISQNGNLPQVGMKIKNIWNHHLVEFHFPCRLLPSLPSQPSPKTPRTKIIKLRSLSWRRARSKSLL